MARYLMTAVRLCLITMVLLGVIYPLIVFGLGQLFFPRQANGSLIREGTAIRGSYLIGQSFTRAGYFHSRPSAAGNGYDPLSSGGSNLGPTSKALSQRVENDVKFDRSNTPGLKEVPVDMVTASGSGLDPDITLANAYAQAPRVAKERGATENAVRALIDQQMTGRQLGLLGEPRVNVVRLNRALDVAYGAPKR